MIIMEFSMRIVDRDVSPRLKLTVFSVMDNMSLLALEPAMLSLARDWHQSICLILAAMRDIIGVIGLA
jgi:hypothetical protein